MLRENDQVLYEKILQCPLPNLSEAVKRHLPVPVINVVKSAVSLQRRRNKRFVAFDKTFENNADALVLINLYRWACGLVFRFTIAYGER